MNYELVYILSPKLSDADAEEKAKDITTQLKHEIRELILEDFWGKKDLAYPINKFEHGYYVLLQFKAKRADIKKIEQKIKLDDEIIRHLIVKKDDFIPIKKKDDERKLDKEKDVEEDVEQVEKESMEEKETPRSQEQETKNETQEAKSKESEDQNQVESSESSELEPGVKKEKKKAKADISDLDKKLDDILDSEIDD